MSENVGSILGYLRLDRSDWSNEIRAAEAEADRLGRSDPNVRIRTNSRDAIAQLAAVAAATRRLQDAQGREAVAEARLADLKERDNVSTSRLRGAEEQLARAQRGTADATIRLAQAHSQNSQNTDRESRSNDKAAKSSSLLMTAIATLGAAAVPVAAAATGVLLGIGPAAGTALLAVSGLRQEWQSGALQGSHFTDQVRLMQSDLSQLKQTAAAGVLPGLSGAMTALAPLFSMVNADVSMFASQIGQIVAALGPALVTLLHDLQPLFGEIGNYLVAGANSLATWVSNGTGVQTFLQYVQAILPTVLSTLGQLVQTVLHLAEALAPIGDVIIKGIGLLAQVINAIPVNVLTGLATAGLAVFVAFKAWTGISAIIKAVAAAMADFELTVESAAGILGAIGAVIGLFVLGMNAGTSATDASKQAMDAYADSVKQSTNALAAANQAQTAKFLSDHGALVMLDELHAANQALGVSYQDLVTGVNGTDQQFQALNQTLKSHSVLGQMLAGVLMTTRQGLHDQIQTTQDYNAAVAQQSQQFKDQAAALQNQASLYGTTTTALQNVQQAQQQQVEQTREQTLQWQLANDAASLLAQTLDRLSGKNLGYAQAQNSFDSALSNMGDHVSSTGKKITFTTTSINNMSAASVALRGQLLGQVQGAEQTAEAYGKMKGSSVDARQKLIDLRQQIINNAVAHGADRKAVTDYIDTVLKIPKTVPPTKLDVEKAQAEQKVRTFESMVANLQGKNVKVTADISEAVQTITAFVTSPATKVVHVVTVNQSGGVASGHFATGGFIHGPGTGTSDTAGLFALSNGEAVIPEKQVRKHRSLIEALIKGVPGLARGGIVHHHKPPAPVYEAITAHDGLASGIAEAIKGNKHEAVAAMRELSDAVNSAFTLRGIDDKLNIAKAQLQNLSKTEAAFNSSVQSGLTQGFDATKYGSVGDLLAGFGGATGSNNHFAAVIGKLGKEGLAKGFLAQLAQAGDSASLESLAGASRSQIAAVSRAYGSYQASLGHAGNVATAGVYGDQAAAQQRNIDRLTAAQAKQAAVVDKLTAAVGRLTNRPVQVEIEGHPIATAVVKDKAFVEVIDHLTHHITY